MGIAFSCRLGKPATARSMRLSSRPPCRSGATASSRRLFYGRLLGQPCSEHTFRRLPIPYIKTRPLSQLPGRRCHRRRSAGDCGSPHSTPPNARAKSAFAVLSLNHRHLLIASINLQSNRSRRNSNRVLKTQEAHLAGGLRATGLQANSSVGQRRTAYKRQIAEATSLK